MSLQLFEFERKISLLVKILKHLKKYLLSGFDFVSPFFESKGLDLINHCNLFKDYTNSQTYISGIFLDFTYLLLGLNHGTKKENKNLKKIDVL